MYSDERKTVVHDERQWRLRCFY